MRLAINPVIIFVIILPLILYVKFSISWVFIITCMTLWFWDCYWRWNYYQNKKNTLVPVLPTFSQYLYYSLTLGLDYSITAVFRLIKSSAHFLLWKIKLIKENEDYNLKIGRAFLDTSLMILYICKKTVRISDESTEIGYFVASDFYVPNNLSPKKMKYHKYFRAKINLKTGIAIECTLENKILSMRAAWILTIYLISIFNHPKIHERASRYGRPDHSDPEIRKGYIYTTGINLAGTLASYPFISMENPDDMYEMLEKNMLNFNKHNYKKLSEISDYSKTFKFLIQTRIIAWKLQEELEIDIDPETLYLSTIMHSIDHYVFSKFEVPFSEDNPDVCNSPFWISVVALLPIWNIFSSTKLRDSRVPWHMEYYDRIKRIDVELADQVDWCIAY